MPDQDLGIVERHTDWEPEGGSGVYRRRLMLWRNFRRSNRKCSLLLFLDGQNLLETGHQGSSPSWSAEHYFSKCSKPLLVAAIPASCHRYPEYVGWSNEHYSATGAKHASFIVRAVIPYLHSIYPNAMLKALVGSSAGGVAALYTAWSYPRVFPGVACLSAGRHYFSELLARFEGLPAPKIYLSCGNQGMDFDFQQANQEFASALKARGALLKLYLHQGDHSEPVWSRRLPSILKFFIDS